MGFFKDGLERLPRSMGMDAHVLVLKFQILVKEDAESEEETRKPKGMSERGFLQRPVKQGLWTGMARGRAFFPAFQVKESLP